jgi:hypothetical protein
MARDCVRISRLGWGAGGEKGGRKCGKGKRNVVNAGCNINLRDATKILIIGSEKGQNAGRSGFWRDSKRMFLDAKYRRGL